VSAKSLKPFNFGCSIAVFSPEEVQALTEHGSLLEALAAGIVQPVGPEQQHFLLVDRDEAEAETLLERAWVRLKGRREFEAEPSSPPPEKVDYGMIEWDREKCWW
jgi:uncharacterized protein YifE (UPF0438 family)